TARTAFEVAMSKEVLAQQFNLIVREILNVFNTERLKHVLVPFGGSVGNSVKLNAFHGGAAFANAVRYEMQAQEVSGNVCQVFVGRTVELDVEPGRRPGSSDGALVGFSPAMQELVLFSQRFVTTDDFGHAGILFQ